MDMHFYATEQGILNERMNVEMQSFANKELERKFLFVNGLNAKFGKDGDQWYFIKGELPEKDCIVGFGNTVEEALNEFYKACVNKHPTTNSIKH